ncbi:MAG: type II toxin-antitoxin system HicA family toxin [Bacteroidales bacterium]|jgi:hypothetical protein|nr:type II toxin-antitoxin system HicA family toxin [Bacteroidales bacterium]
MSRKEKIVARFLSKPKDFRYEELVVLLRIFGYEEINTGKTSGSGRAFVRAQSGHIIRLHRPHPENVMRMYQIELILEELKKQNLI